MSSIKSIVRLALVVAALATTACADAMTEPSPTPNGARASRDTTGAGFLADTLTCRSGWVIVNGRVACD